MKRTKPHIMPAPMTRLERDRLANQSDKIGLRPHLFSEFLLSLLRHGDPKQKCETSDLTLFQTHNRLPQTAPAYTHDPTETNINDSHRKQISVPNATHPTCAIAPADTSCFVEPPKRQVNVCFRQFAITGDVRFESTLHHVYGRSNFPAGVRRSSRRCNLLIVNNLKKDTKLNLHGMQSTATTALSQPNTPNRRPEKGCIKKTRHLVFRTFEIS